MKKFLEVLLQIVMIIWQIPQVLVGLILLAWYHKSLKLIRTYKFVRVYCCKMSGGISLGCFAFLSKYSCDEDNIKHEAIGHTKQSRILGPFYLLVIGLFSILHAGLNDIIGCCKKHKEGYYHFWTEKWADKIAGIKRV